MPQVTADTPRDNFTIAGKEFSVYKPYAEGHPLTANEAASLNQTYGENIRNNFAKTVKAANEAGTFDQEALQTSLDEYMGKYEFGARISSGPRVSGGDPVLARAIELAREIVRKKIREAGGNLKDYATKDINERARKAVEANPRFKELAASQIAQENELDGGVEGLDSAPTIAKEPKAKRAKKEDSDTTSAADAG